MVKTANSFAAELLASDPRQAGGQRVMFLSGDDAEAKSEVGELFEDAGFFVIALAASARADKSNSSGLRWPART